jgi:hypothetical protein
MTEFLRVFLLLMLVVVLPVLGSVDSACSQAEAIVAEVRAMYSSGQPDHQRVLRRLSTARDLCSTLGEAWKYSYCAATALNDPKARFYKDRAIFNGVSSFECGTASRPSTPAPVPIPSYVREKFALIIGIGDFKDPEIGKLQFAAKDAEDLARVLQDPRYGRFKPENVILLTNAKATRSNILNAINDLFYKVQEDDLVFIYVSSHGSQKQTDKGPTGIGYIVTHDANLKDIFVNALDYESFSKQASLLKARRKVVFLDTCFSGQASTGSKALSIEGVGVDPATARLFLSGEGTYVITSSKDNERSFESDSLQNSYFTYFLIEALKKGTEPPTIKEIFSYLTQKVPEAVAREKRSFQHPQMVPGDGPGDVRIGVIPRSQAVMN